MKGEKARKETCFKFGGKMAPAKPGDIISQLKREFDSIGSTPDDATLAECVHFILSVTLAGSELCNLYHISAEDLAFKWDFYSLKEAKPLVRSSLADFRLYLQSSKEMQEKKKATKKTKLLTKDDLDELLTSTPPPLTDQNAGNSKGQRHRC